MYKIKDSIWETNRKERRSNNVFNIIAAIVIAIAIMVIYLNVFVFFSVEVSGASMESTLKSGDTLIVNRTRTAKVGDIVIIEKADGTWIIKRVIGLGGDLITIYNGKVLRNNVELTETYLDSWQKTYIDVKGDPSKAEIRLESDEAFYMGDNRLNSLDARSNGPCKQNKIVGVVEEWSINMKGFLGRVAKWFNGLFGRRTGS